MRATLLLLVCPTLAWGQVRVTPLGDHVILLQASQTNMIAAVGPEGVVVVGAMDTMSARAVAESLMARSPGPRRVVIAMAGLASIGQADAGWDQHGALVIMQEFAVQRMRDPTVPELRRPRAEFSQFFSIELNGEPIHAVRQEPGYATSDVLVHFEGVNVIYLGESFPGDGYPRIDATLGGTVDGLVLSQFENWRLTVDGLVKTLDPWALPDRPESTRRFVGARGALARSGDILAFRDMVKAVAAEVRRLKAAGRGVTDVIAAHPTAAYDQRWGHGLISAERFVRDVYQSAK